MKINLREDTAFLEITSWRAAIGGEHYYGTVKFRSDIWHSLTFPMTKSQADYLNEKDGEGSNWIAGEQTNRYETVASVEKDGVTFFHKELEALGAKILCVGSSVNFQPMKVIAYAMGYGNIALEFSKLYEEGEFCDWDFTQPEDEDVLDEILGRWQEFLEQ